MKSFIKRIALCLFLFCCLLSTAFAFSDPNIILDSNVISFTAYESGMNPDPNVLTISNFGGGPLNWSIVDAGQSTFTPPDWLTVMPTGGSVDPNESEPVTLSVDITGLPGGQYSYLFQISDPSAQNSPQMITVQLRVGAIYVPGDYSTIQAAINAADPNDVIIVSPGTYYENIKFGGKDIILTSTNPSTTVIDGGNFGHVVQFSGSETSNCILNGFTIMRGLAAFSDIFPPQGAGILGNGTHATIGNCIITENDATGYPDYDGWWIYGYGGGVYNCDGTIVNCTIANNHANWGGGLYGCDGSITNCIIWENTAHEGDQLHSSSIPTYSCIQYWDEGSEGNIADDPLFTDPANGDYHLNSQYGRWNPGVWIDPNTPSDPNDGYWTEGHWVYDPNTSPCIDAGDPASIDWQNELWPHGKQINMGAYGGTQQASMSPSTVGNVADLDHDGVVDMSDFSLLTQDWQKAEYLLDTDFDLNGVVNINDLIELGYYWLWPGQAILEIPQTFFSHIVDEGGSNPNPNTLTIENTGVGPLNWSADLIGKPDWLTVTPTSGFLNTHESEPVTLSVDITGLSVGLYNYAFEVFDPNDQNTPQTVKVELSIRGAHIVVPDDVSTIQTAVDLILENGTIIVSPGIYYENLQFPGRDFVLTSTNPNITIIDGMGTGSVVTFSGSETSDCILTGFTITNGYAWGPYPDEFGGGICGGKYQNYTHSTISYCIISGNSAKYGGGLAYCDGSITNCTISGNTSAGLAFCDGSITNCMITSNTANTGGGLYACDAMVTNCTIVNNSAQECGGAFSYCDGEITNCIIWANSAACQEQIYFGSTPTYSCIQDWTGDGTGNITSDPMFIDTSSPDPSLWDLHLLIGSPCIDTGTNTPSGGLPTTDIESNPRIIDGDSNGSIIVDMGAYEYVP